MDQCTTTAEEDPAVPVKKALFETTNGVNCAGPLAAAANDQENSP